MRLVTLFFAVLVSGSCCASAAVPSNTTVTPAAASAIDSLGPGDDAILVQAALSQFDSALALRDMSQLEAAGIQPGRVKGWQKFFKNNPQAKVTDNCPAPSLVILGDTANWDCVETATIISEGKPLPFAHIIRFTFTRKNGGWTISDRR
jgi:hypothetical protein